jgi:hypothetical protein
MDSHITLEAEHVRGLQLEELKSESFLSLSFNGGTLQSGKSVYTLHATTSSGRVVLLEGQDRTGVSHTGQWIADFILQVSTEHLQIIAQKLF